MNDRHDYDVFNKDLVCIGCILGVTGGPERALAAAQAVPMWSRHFPISVKQASAPMPVTRNENYQVVSRANPVHPEHRPLGLTDTASQQRAERLEVLQRHAARRSRDREN